MAVRIEWRTRARVDGDNLNDAVLAIEDGTDTVVRAWPVKPELLVDFLNDMEEFRGETHNGIEIRQLDPANWGALVIARSQNGDVISVNPELYWDGIAVWFRARGVDPHLWRARHRQS